MSVPAGSFPVIFPDRETARTLFEAAYEAISEGSYDVTPEFADGVRKFLEYIENTEVTDTWKGWQYNEIDSLYM